MEDNRAKKLLDSFVDRLKGGSVDAPQSIVALLPP